MANAAVSRLEGAAIIGLLSLGLCGCFAAGHPSDLSGTVRLPSSSWRPGQPARQARGGGVLNGSASDGCVWLEHDPVDQTPGAARSKTPVLWPAGYVARFEPLEILDESGTVVARGGDRIQFGGGLVPVRDDSCMLGVQEVFAIQSEVTVLSR